MLSDDEARQAIINLAALGDEEGTIAYDPTVEVLLQGPQGIAGNGMSGGGAFPITRGATWASWCAPRAQPPPPPRIVRMVRMSYVLGQLETALAALEAAERTEVLEFLETN